MINLINEKLFAYAKVIEKLVNPYTDQPNDENPDHFFEIAQLLFEEKKSAYTIGFKFY